MSEQSEFVNKALKYCNYWALFINFIVIAICIGGIYYVLNYKKQYETKTAKVTNVKNGNCEVRKRISSKKPETYFACELDVTYKGNGDQGENLDKKNVLFTETVTEYKSGDEIQIDYDPDDPDKIRESDKEVQNYMLIFAIIILIITVIATIVRLTMKNNSLVKWWIGFSCLSDIAD
jgi:heme/copper-type cytochrome/quinol oxidase subunit 4